ncbi:MAG: FliA/WhiG family RNA polymerase sigma factor [Solirubrobacteraceae bacterium]|nr:FliA/WhiG family RNA polymerase sigma factor [Solirubrobacteraceae bacterium]
MTAPVYSSSGVRPKSARRADEDLRLVAEYRETGDTRVRDRLVFTYAPLVKYLVGKKLRALPADVDADDLTSAGLEALVRCIDRFDPEAGASLEAYVWTRVQGAILDELRRGDWAPRAVRRSEREAATASERFRREHGRDPDSTELADELGISLNRLHGHQHDVAAATVGSLNTTVVDSDNTDIERLDTLRSEDPTLDPEHAAIGAAARERLARAIGELSNRDREIMVMLHTHHMTLSEIGKVMGVSESRISQIHTSVRAKLAEELADDRVLFEMT